MQWKKRKPFFLLVLLTVLGCFTLVTQSPKEIRMLSGQLEQLSFPMPVTMSTQGKSVVAVSPAHQPTKNFTLLSKQQGNTELTLKLFGKLPFSSYRIQVIPDRKVIPGGQSIGVKLQSRGVLVVGHHFIHTKQGEVSPAEKTDIRIGDYITQINETPVKTVDDIARLVNQKGKSRESLHLTIQRGNNTKQVRMTPMYDSKDNSYRLGLYTRDSATGVGTLTFYDPGKQVYGALGHVVSDMDTGQPIQVGGGKVVHSNVTSIQKGESGEPGEKRAIFFQENRVLGNILKNTPFGVFGSMKKRPDQGKVNQPIPVALANQVKTGPAKIYTVVHGQKVEAFDIQITHVLQQKLPATKGMIIKVTDPRLLNKTGGIVQGMSGSPIIQNGKLVGAVTHVLVNDPTSGYGTYIEWMLQDAGVISQAADFKTEVAAFL